jgi:hypothetical protein
MRYWCAMPMSYVTLSAGEWCICSWCCRRSVASVYDYYDYWSSQAFKISNFPIIERVWRKCRAGYMNLPVAQGKLIQHHNTKLKWHVLALVLVLGNTVYWQAKDFGYVYCNAVTNSAGINCKCTCMEEDNCSDASGSWRCTVW